MYIGNHFILSESLSDDHFIDDGTVTIANNAFYNCIDLKSITIPNSVSVIGTKGQIKGEKLVDCQYCVGGTITSSTICSECHGAGKFGETCSQCNGKGYMLIYPQDGFLLGDADGDGSVSIIDVTCIQRHLAELEVASYNEIAADADGDGLVTILDATGIQRYLAELPCNIGIGKVIT